VKKLKSGRSRRIKNVIKEYSGQPFMVDPEWSCRRVRKNITIREIALFPENTAEREIPPKVIVSNIS